MERQILNVDHADQRMKVGSPCIPPRSDKIISCIRFTIIFAVATVMTLPLIIIYLPSRSDANEEVKLDLVVRVCVCALIYKDHESDAIH